MQDLDKFYLYLEEGGQERTLYERTLAATNKVDKVTWSK